jgi:hypothetical protein
MPENNQTYEALFHDAVNAYKDWCMCGKDFLLHEPKWDAWDDAVRAYMSETLLNRMEAINQIRSYLGMEKLA